MSAIATTTSQSHDCGQDQVLSVVLRLVQYHVHFHCHDSEGRLLAACIGMCCNDTNSPIRHVGVSICTQSCMTEVFRRRLKRRTQSTVGCTIIFHVIL